MSEKTYFEILREHYPNADKEYADKEFYLDYCPRDFFNGAVNYKCDECDRISDCEKCWNMPAKEEWCEKVSDIPDEWKAAKGADDPSDEELEEEKTALKNAIKSVDEQHSVPTVQPERAAEVAEKFNYAVLTAELGDYLRHKEEQLRNEYMNFTANCGRIFAEAQEKLAKHGFGENNGVFDKWISSMGFAKPTVYRMISVYNFRSSQIETNEQAQLFDSLSKSLQYEVAKPSAPPELVEQVMNGDITTHKEYIKLKKELSEAQAEIEKLNREADEADREYDAMADRECHYETEICKLEQRIRELENKPVDVAVDVDELNRRVSEAANKMNSEMEHTLAAERRDFADTLNAKDDRIWELEDEVKKLKSSSASPPTAKILAFQMSMEQYKKLLEIVSGSDNSELYKVIQGVKIFS